MKMKKALLTAVCLMLAVVMGTLVLAGCSSGKFAKDTIKIGGIGPTTGVASVYGQSVKNAMMLAADEINDKGGLNGVMLEIKFEDDAHNAETSVNAYNKLMAAGMQVLIGTVTSGPCKAVVPRANDENVFMLTPSGSALACIQKVDANDTQVGTYENAYRICFNDPDQGKASAAYIAANMPEVETVGIIYNSGDIYSTGITNTFESQAAADGEFSIVKAAFTSDDNADFSSQLNVVKDCQLIFLPIYAEPAANILTQAKETYANNYANKLFFGCDGLDGIVNKLGDKSAYAEGVMLLTSFAADAEDDLTKDFVAAYKARFNQTPDQFAAAGYDAVYTVFEGLKMANLADIASVSASDICDALVKAMTDGLTVTGVTGTMQWTADGEPQKAAKSVKIQNGAYVLA